MLFSEPKIPQFVDVLEQFVIIPAFQCSSASRKFLNRVPGGFWRVRRCVSVLFSEPKIPQSRCRHRGRWCWRGFSALQRAENSSMNCALKIDNERPGFSALQRAENSSMQTRSIACDIAFLSFSALQRAENSSIAPTQASPPEAIGIVSVLFSEPKIPQFPGKLLYRGVLQEFQCSSASRKFLNAGGAGRAAHPTTRFSALQRAENSSIHP